MIWEPVECTWPHGRMAQVTTGASSPPSPWPWPPQRAPWPTSKSLTTLTLSFLKVFIFLRSFLPFSLPPPSFLNLSDASLIRRGGMEDAPEREGQVHRGPLRLVPPPARRPALVQAPAPRSPRSRRPATPGQVSEPICACPSSLWCERYQSRLQSEQPQLCNSTTNNSINTQLNHPSNNIINNPINNPSNNPINDPINDSINNTVNNTISKNRFTTTYNNNANTIAHITPNYISGNPSFNSVTSLICLHTSNITSQSAHILYFVHN